MGIVVREYECGCRITSDKNYPSIKYCPKHKSAPDLCEALEGLLDWYDDLTLNNPDLESPIFWNPAIKALRKAGRKPKSHLM